MLLILGYLVVFCATMGGFVLAGGNPVVLLHISEFVSIFGIAIEELPVSDLKTPAYNYLLRCGMNEQQIDRLINYLVTDDFGG